MWYLTPEMAAGYNSLKAWVESSEAMAEEYKQLPPPIEVEAAKKKVRDKGLVDELASFYTANRAPAEQHVMPEWERIRFQEDLAYFKELDAMQKEMAPVLQKEIEFVKETRTNEDTTVLDVRVNYPTIHEEIEDEIERREWRKDTKWDPNRK